MKGWLAAIMRMWLSTERKRLPLRPHGLAQSNTGRCSSARCGAPSSVMAPQTCSLAASMSFLEKPRCASRSKAGSASFSAGICSVSVRNSSPSVQRLKTNLMSKAVLQRRLELAQHLVGEALGLERGVVDGRRLRQRAVADRVGLDLRDLGLAVAQRAQGLRHGLVDDLEVAAAGQLLELHQREVGLDAGGVAVHDEADGAGGRDHGRPARCGSRAPGRARGPGPRRVVAASTRLASGRRRRRAAPAAWPASRSPSSQP